ncbi:MAG: LysR family transcriptional regulator [Sneathiella sp.]|nr:LysR family transcriptional regulator [Sneathiella sp.]
MKHAQLKAFHAVAKYGGFTPAARSLGLTQPAVTLQVQALERKYDTPLFIRRGRKVDLTQPGILLLSLSTRYFNLEEEAHTLLSSIMQLKAEKLRIVSDIAPRVFPLTSKFREKYPNIELSASICQQQQIEENLLDHLVDIALTGTKPEDPTLEYHTISEENVTVTFSKQYPLDEKIPVSFEELCDLKVFIFEDTDGIGKLEKDLIKIANFPEKNIVKFKNREMVLEAVAYNQGISFLSEREVSHDRRLKSVPLNNCPLKRVDYLVYHKENRNTPLASAFRNTHVAE